MPNQLGEAYIQSAGWIARAGGGGLSCLIRASRCTYLDSSISIFSISPQYFIMGEEGLGKRSTNTAHDLCRWRPHIPL